MAWRSFTERSRPVVAEVYSPGSEVELLLNGESLGRQPCGPEYSFTVYFELSYQPGVLEAVAWDVETELGRMELRVSVSGAGKLTGLASGDPRPAHSFAGDVVRTFRSRTSFPSCLTCTLISPLHIGPAGYKI